MENQTWHLVHNTTGFVCNRAWAFRFVLEVCGCWWQCCGGMFVGARPVLEQRTDESFLKIYFSVKKLFVYTYFTYNHRYSKYTNHRKHVQASFILPLGLLRLYLTLKIVSRSLNLEDLKSIPFHVTCIILSHIKTLHSENAYIV